MKTLEQVVDEAYEILFKYMADNYNSDIKDIKVVVKIMSDGKTIRRSYQDRERWLGEEETR